jgi:endonuclease/exonuclease/phosphatase (EEP) superfamily protein YafD
MMDGSSPPPRRIEPRRRILIAFAGVLAAATGASLLGAWWWVPALIAHFRPHLATASLILLAVSALGRRRRLVALAIVLLIANGAPLLPYLGGGARAATAGNLRILALNMHGAGTERLAFNQMMASEHPDVVVLTELPINLDHIVREAPDLPAFHVGEPQRSPWVIAVFSRWPVARWSVDRGTDGSARVLTADICDTPAWRGCLRLVALHAPRPFGDGARRQREQLQVAATAAAAAPDHRAILAGDLNLTPWAPEFGHLIEAGDLRDTGPYRGLLATWLSRLPFVGLLIDHVLVSPSIGILANRLGPDVGSDHLPVIADLAVPTAP